MAISQPSFASGVSIDRSPAPPGRFKRRIFRLIWFVLAPALLTALYLRYAVPTLADPNSVLAALARAKIDYPVPFAVALFMIFAVLFRYWRHYLPWSGWLMAPLTVPRNVPWKDLDAFSVATDLIAAVREARTMRRLARTLSAEQMTELENSLVELEETLAAANVPGAARAERAVRHLAAAALRARDRRQTAIAVGVVAFAGLAGLFVRGNVFTPIRVLSASMLPTLTPGDLLVANRLAYGGVRQSANSGSSGVPRRGDIVVFRGPESEENAPELIKRVIGLPGDLIAMHGSSPIINGWEVPNCDAGLYVYIVPGSAIKARLLVEFLDDRAYLTIAAAPPRSFPDPYQVKPGEVFVIGDNRNNSGDSRAWNEGRGAGVPLDQLGGNAPRFLLAARRDRGIDVNRLFESTQTTRLHLEGLDTEALREGIVQCLSRWPKETSAPPPNADDRDRSPTPNKMLGE